MNGGPSLKNEESAGARLTDRAAALLQTLHKGKNSMTWLQVIAIVVPVLSGLWAATSVTMGRLKESAAVTASRLEDISTVLAEVKGGQKRNSDEVIRLRSEVGRLTTELERLRTAAVTKDRLKIETVEREALEKRMSDLFGKTNAELFRNTGRIETLRKHHP